MSADAQFDSENLTRRANQWQIDILATIKMLAPGPVAALRNRRARRLIRRANHQQTDIIAKIMELAPGVRQRLFGFLATSQIKFDTSGKSPAN